MLKTQPRQPQRRVDSVRPLRQPEIVRPVFVYKKAATRVVSEQKARRAPRWLLAPLVFIVLGYGVWHFVPEKTITRVSETVAALVPSLPVTGAKDNSDQMQTMQTAIQAIITANPDLTIGVSVNDVRYGTKVNVGSAQSFTGASTTKVLTAAAFLNTVEKGSNSLTETANGYPLSWHLQQMINQSNNDSWSLLNDKVGYSQLAAYAKSIGMTNYAYTDNSIGSADTALLLQKLYSGKLLTKEHTQLVLSYMQNTNNDDMIPAAVDSSITTYHKYGQLDGYLHDVGILVKGDHAVAISIYTSAADGSNYNGRVAVVRQIVKAITTNLYTQ